MDDASATGYGYAHRLTATDENANQHLKPQHEAQQAKDVTEKRDALASTKAEPSPGDANPGPGPVSETLTATSAQPPSSPSNTTKFALQQPPPQQEICVRECGKVSETRRLSASSTGSGNSVLTKRPQSAIHALGQNVYSLERLIERQLGNAFSSPVPAARQPNKLYFVGVPQPQAGTVRNAAFQRIDKRPPLPLAQSPQSPPRRLSVAQAEFVQTLENMSHDGDPTELFALDTAISQCGLRGNLYAAIDRRDGSPVDIEVIAIEEYTSDLYPLCSELIADSNLKHAGLAEQEGYYFQRSTGQLWVVARRPAGTTLAECCRDGDAPLGEEEVARIVHECIQTLRYLQQRGFTYNLLNAETVYVGEDGDVQLSRLGCCTLAWQAASTRRGTIARALHYASAPEVIKRKPSSPKADTWSIGVLVYELLHGRRPHQDLDFDTAMSKTLRNGLRKMAKTITASPQAINFLDRCLRKHPLKRAAAEEISRHPFLRKGSVASLNTATARAA